MEISHMNYELLTKMTKAKITKEGATMSNSRIYYSLEAETQAIRQITMMTVLWLAVGLAMGVVMALLFAPSTGEKMRNNLWKGIEGGLDSGQDAIEPVVKKLEKEVGELRQTVEDRISKLR
jgi:hypothetical protein